MENMYNEEGYKIEYRITGRFRGSDSRHVVDFSRTWTHDDAKKRFDELKRISEAEMKNKVRKSMNVGMISVGTQYNSEYDLLELRIESRRVSKWKAEE